MDMAKCEEEREQGNTAFKEARYPEAVAHYNEALKRCGGGAHAQGQWAAQPRPPRVHMHSLQGRCARNLPTHSHPTPPKPAPGGRRL